MTEQEVWRDPDLALNGVATQDFKLLFSGDQVSMHFFWKEDRCISSQKYIVAIWSLNRISVIQESVFKQLVPRYT